MKNKVIKRILCAAAALILLIGVLTALAPGLMRRPSPRKYFGFYEYAQDYDVLFLGSSHVLNSIIPIQLWDEHGITAYNLGMSGSTIAMDYWTLQNALQYAAPKLVVLDCASLAGEKVNVSADYNHAAIDDLRHLPTKIDAVFDLFDAFGDKLGYLFPQRDADARDLSHDGKLGFTWLRTIKPVELPDFAAVTDPSPVDNISIEYLRRIILECRELGIDILLTYIPFNANENSLNEAAFMHSIAAEYGLRYLSAPEINAVLNPRVDFGSNYGDDVHLNLSGAQKLSTLIGSYIAEHYDIPDHRGTASYAHWDELSSTYHSEYRALLKRQKTPAEYLMALYHNGYSVLIEAGSPQLLKSPVVRDMLENLGADMSRITQETDCILLGSSSAYFEDFWSSPSSQETFLGRLSLGVDAKGECILTLNKKTLLEKPSFSAAADSITFLVLDSESHKVLNTTTFAAEDFLPEDVAQYLADHGQEMPLFAASAEEFTNPTQLYILPDGKLYVPSAEGIPDITIQSRTGGYWYANESEPLGVFNDEPNCSAKRTNLVPVIPGDQLMYSGFAEFTPDSVVWLNEREHLIDDEKHQVKHDAVIVTAPEDAAYVWFASFDYGAADEVVLDVKWVTCQAVSSSVSWTDSGIRLYPEE